jgi:hypothetical protein
MAALTREATAPSRAAAVARRRKRLVCFAVYASLLIVPLGLLLLKRTQAPIVMSVPHALRAAVDTPCAHVMNSPALRRLASDLIFLVPVAADSRTDLVNATWGSCAPNVIFVGTCPACTLRVSLETGSVESWASLPAKVMAMWRAAPAAFPHARAFMKVDLDTFVFYSHLLRSLAAYEMKYGQLPVYMGSVYQLLDNDGAPLTGDTGLRYASGGAGYLLNRDTAVVLQGCDTSAAAALPGGAYEDALVGRCLASVGIRPRHHPGFMGDTLEAALRHWLTGGAVYPNHVGDPTVPLYPITVHGYKDPYALLALGVLARSGQRPDWPAPWSDVVGPPAYSRG